MKYFYTLIFFGSTFFFCTGHKNEISIDREALHPEAKKDNKIPYDSLRTLIEERRNIFSSAYLQAESDSARKKVVKESKDYLISMLTDTVFPYWFGTNWAFSGITEKPNNGYIACGYFVSTTLKHVGFKLNRYKLAQQASALIAKSVSGTGNISTLKTIPEVKKNMESRADGLYVLGLDYHVGFLLKEKDELFFIHSNYLAPRKVTREKFSISEAVLLSDIFVIGEILSDKNVEKWLKQEIFVVQTK